MLLYGVRRKTVIKMTLPMLLFAPLAIYFYTFFKHSMHKLRNEDGHLDDMRLYVQDNRDFEAHGVLHSQDKRSKIKDGQFAYVTLMCEDSWLPQMRVLAYSWKKIKSSYPLVVMALPWATNFEELEALGAVIKKIQYINVPFKRHNGKRMSFEKACRYSKIHAWSLVEYQRAVYIDPSLMIVQNIDELFQYTADFSAVKVVGDEFNTGLFVYRPEAATHEKMLSAYPQSPPESRGEQGFLNWFFLEKETRVLSARYNTVVRLKDYAVWPLLKRSAKVFHFSPSSTPWNFYLTAYHEFESNFEPSIFGYWNLIHQQSLQLLGMEEYSVNNTWPNAKRVSDTCTSITSLYNPKRFHIINKFSVVIGTWDRFSLLRKIILHYQKSRLVHKIYVTWHNPAKKPPEEFIRLVRKKPPVELLPQKYDSLNNRFNPLPNLETKAVLIADDDIRVNITDMEYGFEVWKNRPQSLIGVFPRYHRYHPSNRTYTYEIRSPDRPRMYSIMLTKYMFMSSEYLYVYTCLLPTKIHRYIDEKMNCEDIAMNLLVSGMTGSKPVAVMLGVDDFGTTSGISIKQGHLSNRSECMTDLIRLFQKDTLRYNREVFIPYRKRRF